MGRKVGICESSLVRLPSTPSPLEGEGWGEGEKLGSQS